MSEHINLKDIERRAWRSTFSDGLWDIYLGLILLSMGVSHQLDRLVMTEGIRTTIYVSVMVAAMLFLWMGKRFITTPRIGQAKFSAERQKRRRKTSLVLFLSVMFGLGVWFLSAFFGQGQSNPAEPWRPVMPLVYVLNMLVVFGLMGYFLEFERLYFIGAMFAIPLPLDLYLRTHWSLDIGSCLYALCALAVVAVGAVYLARFLRTHPLPDVSDEC
jgi:hypothetical protein